MDLKNDPRFKGIPLREEGVVFLPYNAWGWAALDNRCFWEELDYNGKGEYQWSWKAHSWVHRYSLRCGLLLWHRRSSILPFVSQRKSSSVRPKLDMVLLKGNEFFTPTWLLMRLWIQWLMRMVKRVHRYGAWYLEHVARGSWEGLLLIPWCEDCSYGSSLWDSREGWEIRSICDTHEVLLVEDAAESMGSTYTVALGSELERKLGKSGAIQTGNFGEFGIVSFNGNNVSMKAA